MLLELEVKRVLAGLSECDRLVLEDYYARLVEMAGVDALTEVYNRRGLRNRLVELNGRAERGELEEVVVIMADLDHFKKVNDTFGHDFGDLYLKMVARVLKRNSRLADVVARYGGDEFVMVWPVAKGYDKLGGEELEKGVMAGNNGSLVKQLVKIERDLMAERKKMILEREDWLVDGRAVGGLSFGAVVYSGSMFAEIVGEETEELVGRLTKLADKGMYKNKNER